MNEDEDFECIGCYEEVNIFGKEIANEYVCGDCAEPYLTQWYEEYGRDMPLNITQQNKIVKILINKKNKIKEPIPVMPTNRLGEVE